MSERPHREPVLGIASSVRIAALGLLLACAALASAIAAAGRAPRGHVASVGPAALAGPSGRIALSDWTLREDPSGRGLAFGWQRGGFGGTAVHVPSVLRPRDYAGPAGTRNFEGSLAWYRTAVRAPHAGTYAVSFQSANFRAAVWLDGRLLGRHVGPYLPFELRASLSAGTHQLVVRVDWRNPGEQTLLGFHRTWFNWGGLNGAVDVRPIGSSELLDPTVQSTLTTGAGGPAARVRVTVEVVNHAGPRTIAPEGSLLGTAGAIPLPFAPLTLAHGQSATASATVNVVAPALWSPAHPNLYTLSLGVGQESSYSARVGLRELTWRAGRVYLNGHRLLLHGATIQEDAPAHGDALTSAEQGHIVAELKAIGANTARAQHPLDPALLERLDAAGILVWQGIGPVEGAGNWFSSTPGLLAAAEQQARTAALAERLHPSIIGWNLVDEVAGNGRNAAEVSYVQSTARWLHAHDPGRMVGADVWGDHPPEHAGALYAGVDAVAETDYSGWYDHPSDSSAQLISHMRGRLAAMERTFAGKVLLISEFGAESNSLNAYSAPGGYGYQARLLAAHISVYRADPRLTGMLIWLLSDYPLTPTFQGGSIHSVLPQLRLIEGLNQKGLFMRDGRPKAAVPVVARLFKAMPSD
jgi:hypothetical protein